MASDEYGNMSMQLTTNLMPFPVYYAMETDNLIRMCLSVSLSTTVRVQIYLLYII